MAFSTILTQGCCLSRTQYSAIRPKTGGFVRVAKLLQANPTVVEVVAQAEGEEPAAVERVFDG
jgi:hypothetical protein